MSNTSSLPLPVYSFPSLISSWAPAIHADTDKWIEQDFYFLPDKMRYKYRLSNFGKISARCLPCMPTYEHLQVAAKFMLWGTIFDDYFEFMSREELCRLHDRAISILQGAAPRPEETPLFAILVDIRNELIRLMPGYWLQRFAANVAIWIASMQEEVPYKGVMLFPSLADFMMLREKTIGVQAYLDLIEMQLDYSLPDEVMKSDYMKELYRLTARIFGWCNDFHSILKDIGREPLNLVLVLQNEYNISLEEANAMAMTIHDEDVLLLCDLQANMPGFGIHHQQAQLFVYYLGVMIHGQNEWYLHDTLRYKKGGHPEKDSFKE
jgi:hypothetical protein